jgi:hypothetical protein
MSDRSEQASPTAEDISRASAFHDEHFKVHSPEFDWGMYEWMAASSAAENSRLLEQNCKLQDDVAEIVSTHRSDWSWDDVIKDVKALMAERDTLRSSVVWAMKLIKGHQHVGLHCERCDWIQVSADALKGVGGEK